MHDQEGGDGNITKEYHSWMSLYGIMKGGAPLHVMWGFGDV